MTRPTDDELRQWKAICEDKSCAIFLKGYWEEYLTRIPSSALPRLIAEVEHLRREIERLEHGYWSLATRHKILSDDVFGERE